MSRTRNFCFTLNNYTEDVYQALLAVECKYVCIGKEIAPETATPHLQGFIVFKNARTLASLKKLDARAHWEVCRGTPEQNRTYCSKGGDFEERGVKPVSKEENGEVEKARWRTIIDLAESGDWDALRSEHPDVYATRLSQLHLINKKRARDLSTIQGDLGHVWIHGETGCGKSRFARDSNPDAYIKDPNSIWWDGYNGQDVVIIEDFDCFQVKQGGDMKRWLDRYPFQAQFKGGMEMVRPKRIIVTSQYTPAEIWSDDKTVSAIMRRVIMMNYEKASSRLAYVSFGEDLSEDEAP